MLRNVLFTRIVETYYSRPAAMLDKLGKYRAAAVSTAKELASARRR